MLIPFTYRLTSDNGDVQSRDPVYNCEYSFFLTWCLPSDFCPPFLWIKKKNMVPM
jgi:hypothetical protein